MLVNTNNQDEISLTKTNICFHLWSRSLLREDPGSGFTGMFTSHMILDSCGLDLANSPAYIT